MTSKNKSAQGPDSKGVVNDINTGIIVYLFHSEGVYDALERDKFLYREQRCVARRTSTKICTSQG